MSTILNMKKTLRRRRGGIKRQKKVYKRCLLLKLIATQASILFQFKQRWQKKNGDNCRIRTCAGKPKRFLIFRLNHSAKLPLYISPIFSRFPLCQRAFDPFNLSNEPLYLLNEVLPFFLSDFHEIKGQFYVIMITRSLGPNDPDYCRS